MKFKVILNVATLVAIGLVLVFGWHDIEAAFRQMRQLDLWVLALFIPIQLFSFYAVAQVYAHFFRLTGTPISMKTLLPAAIELNFVNHIFPSGGVSGFSDLTIRLKRDGVSTAKSTLAQLVRYVLSFLTFIVLLVGAVLVLAIEDRASGFIIFVATVLTSVVVFSTMGLAFVIGSERRIKGFVSGLARVLNRIIHVVRRSHPETIGMAKLQKTLQELHKDYLLLRKDFGKMKQAMVWALLGNIAEVALIYVTFMAHDMWVNPGAVIIAYAVATIAGLLAILPGGIGVYEPLMAAVLVSSGIPAGVALSVTLVSRVAGLLLALSTGYVLYHIAIKRYARHRTER